MAAYLHIQLNISTKNRRNAKSSGHHSRPMLGIGTPPGQDFPGGCLRNMTPSAQKSMADIAKMYVSEGYPGRQSLGFTPEDHEEVAYNELRARGLIAPMTTESWCLTHAGLVWTLEQTGSTQAALKALRDIGRMYIEAGYPEAGCWAFSPDGDEEVAYGELRDRGFIAPLTLEHWRLTDGGVRWVMDHCA